MITLPIDDVWLTGDSVTGVPGQREPMPDRSGSEAVSVASAPGSAATGQRPSDRTDFHSWPDLPPLPVLRPLPSIRPLSGWLGLPEAPAPDRPTRPAGPGPTAAPPPTAPVGHAARTADEVTNAGATPADSRAIESGRSEGAPPTQPPPTQAPLTQAPLTQAPRRRRRAPEPMPVDQGDDAPRRHPEAHSSMRSSAEQAGPARRRVLVIGGSGTVGSAVVRALTTQGARVAVHSEGRAAEADQLVATLPGEGHLGVAGDLSDGDAVAGLVRFVDAAFEGLDVVINAASFGESAASPSILGSSLTEWTDAWTASLTFDVLGAATVAHAAANAFVERGVGGRIILLAARGRPFGQWRGSVTAATEDCVAALGAALATELAPQGVSVTVIGSGSAAAPGWSPDVLADTVAWLASGPSVVLPGAVVTIVG